MLPRSTVSQRAHDAQARAALRGPAFGNDARRRAVRCRHMPFSYYEIVRVLATPATTGEHIAGLEGAVLGIAAEDDGEIVSYAVSIYERDGICWSLAPTDLEPTGRHDRHENFCDGTSIRVSEQGELLDPPPAR